MPVSMMPTTCPHRGTTTTTAFDTLQGQTIRVYLLGTADSSLQTSFVVDDFALNVQ